MSTMKIMPVEGSLILMAERGMTPVPADGAIVEASAFYRTAVMHGDLTQVPDDEELLFEKAEKAAIEKAERAQADKDAAAKKAQADKAPPAPPTPDKS